MSKNKVYQLTWINKEHDDGRKTTKTAEQFLDEWLSINPEADVYSINRSDSGSAIANRIVSFTIMYKGTLG